MLEGRPLHPNDAPGSGGEPDERPRFDVIRLDREGRTGQALHPFDLEHVRPNPGDARTHSLKEPAEVLHVRLGGRVPDQRASPGQHGRHDGVLRGRDRWLIQEDVTAPELRGMHLEALLFERRLSPQLLKRQEVGIKTPPPDHVPAGRGKAHASHPREERTGQEDRGPDPPGELWMEARGRYVARLDAYGSGRRPVHGGAEGSDDLEERFHVPDSGNVSPETTGSAVRRAAAMQGRGRVLVSGGP